MNSLRGQIGVVGGVGPYAGLDLCEKICEQTLAHRDQEHLPLVLVSWPQRIPDRTEYLLGKGAENPAQGLFSVLQSLAKMGVTVAGIPCNTAHAPEIFTSVQRKLRENNYSLKLLNMIDETVAFIQKKFPEVQRIGILSTLGTFHSHVFQQYLAETELDPLFPTLEVRTRVHEAIYNASFGIKVQANPVTPQATKIVREACEGLIGQGAQAIILGCTELPLALHNHSLHGVPCIDPTLVLARALIRHVAPEKLKPSPFVIEESEALALASTFSLIC